MNYKIILSLLLNMATGTIASAQTINVMTYNIRLDTDSDGENKWELRKDFLLGQLRFYEPGVFGVQEATPNQMDALDAGLSHYKYIGVGRDDGKRAGEFSAIFYNEERFKLLESDTFWLSETPDVPSKGWDAALPRICTYGLFKTRKKGKKFWVFNTHFDHVGEKARENSVLFIQEKAAELNTKNYPVIIMGDFNLEPESKAIQLMTENYEDARLLAGNNAFGPEGTFNGWKTEQPVTRRIDYIFLSPDDFKLCKYAVLSDYVNLHYASDHLPVLVQLNYK